MARLPQPGGDPGQWGNILNDYLAVTLDDNGTIRANTVGTIQLKPQSITNSAIASGVIEEDRLHSDVQAKLNAVTVESVTSVAGKTGVILLDKDDIGLSNVDNTSDSAKPISSATQTALNTKQTISEKGAINGYASLNSSAKLTDSQLPDYLSASELEAAYVGVTALPIVVTSAFISGRPIWHSRFGAWNPSGNR